MFLLNLINFFIEAFLPLYDLVLFRDVNLLCSFESVYEIILQLIERIFYINLCLLNLFFILLL